MSKKTQKKIEKLLFKVYENGLQQKTTDLTAYYEKIEQALNIPVVSTYVCELSTCYEKCKIMQPAADCRLCEHLIRK